MRILLWFASSDNFRAIFFVIFCAPIFCHGSGVVFPPIYDRFLFPATLHNDFLSAKKRGRRGRGATIWVPFIFVVSFGGCTLCPVVLFLVSFFVTFIQWFFVPCPVGRWTVCQTEYAINFKHLQWRGEGRGAKGTNLARNAPRNFKGFFSCQNGVD